MATATSKGPVIASVDNKITFRGESARSRTFELAKSYIGKPASDFIEAWEAAKFEILGAESKQTKGTNKAVNTGKGWLRTYVRRGWVVLK